MKNLFQNNTLSRWLIFLFISLLFGGTLYISTSFVNRLKQEEKIKVQSYARALELMGGTDFIDSNTQEFLLSIIENNQTIPVILADENNEILDTKNIREEIVEDEKRLEKYFTKIRKSHDPIEIDLFAGKNFIYYENSSLLNQLQYYPIILVFLISIFTLFSYWYFRTIRKTEESNLWAGMAKETAHQIGTPLSSLMGWIELLKMEDIDQTSVDEIEKDVNRLKQIADRFSKIGSITDLKTTNIVEVSKKTMEYLRHRLSQNIEFTFHTSDEEIFVNLSEPLFSWVLENLIKNAADAMENKGLIGLYLEDREDVVSISLQDTGAGIPKKLQKKVFEPGFSTKKRGWGLGLSLAKRIIEDYHRGKIYIEHSSKEKGTEFTILLKK
ncbi:sensor histidine kinase [Vaginella massiliensis]|uniref:sensor histidine kinase n=1 Tax=Vaginella massiliensis TaxID=1816680 RepID=UPI0008380490|nr:HAMP domain-containing sensor histidine kinase [Vaginella massiliensis]